MGENPVDDKQGVHAGKGAGSPNDYVGTRSGRTPVDLYPHPGTTPLQGLRGIARYDIVDVFGIDRRNRSCDIGPLLGSVAHHDHLAERLNIGFQHDVDLRAAIDVNLLGNETDRRKNDHAWRAGNGDAVVAIHVSDGAQGTSFHQHVHPGQGPFLGGAYQSADVGGLGTHRGQSHYGYYQTKEQ